MGIQGLIPFLEKSSRAINISQFAGCTVAIDAYCWLHKGAFSCADKLARGEKSDMYVNYCMKYVNMLLSHNIKPILVFDGRHLPAKACTEKKRRQNREINRKRAAELLRQDKPNEARTYLQRCVDVTHMMAVELMRQCRSRNVDCITAPYEADAQLAFLNISNIAHLVITEDSDLLLFGCTKVMFKLDLNGNGLLVEQSSLYLSMGVSHGCFSLEKFRHMCILSGCDYLPSLPKIGLAKACRFVKSTVDPDIHRALSRLGGHLNMNISVPLEYRNKFLEADAMFRHQPVFDPLTRRLVPLTPTAPGATPPPLLAQETLSEDQLLDLALGNLDPFTLGRVDDWTPDKERTGKSSGFNMRAPHKSIWSTDYKPKVLVIDRPDPCHVTRTPTSGKVLERKVDLIPKLPEKRSFSSAQDEMKALFTQFGSSPPSKKPRCSGDNDVLKLLDQEEHTPPKSEVKPELGDSPQKVLTNPFSKKSSPPSGNKFSGLSKLAQFRKTTMSDTTVVQSRFFGSAKSVANPPASSPKDKNTIPLLTDLSNTKSVAKEMLSPRKIVEKLTDDGISSLIEELDESESEVKPAVKGKENSSSPSKLPKLNSSFRGRTSLSDMFGYKARNLSSTPAVKAEFNPPSKKLSVDEITKMNNSDSIQEGKIENFMTCRRNPFAKKTTKVEVSSSSDGLASQGSSVTSDYHSDVSANEESENSFVSPVSPEKLRTSTPVTNPTPRPRVKVGLSKKQTNNGQNLLTMFAFKPKAKLQL